MKKIFSLFLSIAMLATVGIVPMTANADVATASATEAFSVQGCYGWNEYAYAKFTGSVSEVSYKKTTENNYTKVDSELIRNSEGRVDIPGLAKNTEYTIKLVGTDGTTAYYNVTTKANDRSGYAFFNHSGIGAYNEDGTLKSNADVIYVTNETKNTVTYNGITGIGNILKNASRISKPLAVRIIGTIDTQTRDADGTKTTDINNGVVAIDGLTDKIISNGKDSYFNMLDVTGSKGGLTVEGIGDDANILKWGFTFKSNCQDVEVRNLTFSKYPEDACAAENSKYFWLHNCVFNIGENKYDITEEQDKGDGDGATDMNGNSNVTIAYCRYNQTHKTSLNGGSDSVKSYNYTYHHNFFNGCKSRLPLTRQVNLHMYNNYYLNCGTCIDARASALVLSENQYFEGSSNCYKVTANSSEGNPAIKAVGDILTSSKYSKRDNIMTDASRDAALTTTGNKNANPSFDTNSSVFYYSNGASNVEKMDTAEQVKVECSTYAGVLEDTKADAGSINTNPDVTVSTVSTETTTEVTTEAPTETTTVDDSLKHLDVSSSKTFEPADVTPDGTVDVLYFADTDEYLLQDNATNASSAWNNTFEPQKSGKLVITGKLTAGGKAGSKWAFCRVKGINSAGEANEIAAFTTDASKNLALRAINKEYVSSTTALELDKTYNYKFEFDIDNKTVTLTIDDMAPLTAAIDVSEISSVYFVTATSDTERTLTVTKPVVGVVSEGETYVYGDADNDTAVTAADSAMIMQKVLTDAPTTLETVTDKYMTYIDVDKSGVLTAADATYVLQKSLDSTFNMPCEK